MRGKFISVEGIDGAGKSTHLAWLADYLRARDTVFIQTREPGGTPLGEELRRLLLSEPMQLETEALLMFAARNEHMACVIEPALMRGDWVLCDRFTDSSFAFQSGGRGLSQQKFLQLEQWVQLRDGELLQPDLTILFDVPTEVGLQRMHSGARVLDRFEREDAGFHQRVREAYLARAAAQPERIKVIDASRSLADIQMDLQKLIEGWLQ